MNFLVIGHSVVDTIIDNGKISIKPGGIFYAVVSLLSQIQKEDKIYLCSAIDKESEKYFKDAFDKIEKEFLYYIDSIPRVELIINNVVERKETYSQMTEHLILPENNLDNFDGILINMISGNDISLSQIEQIRSNYKGLIYFDVHTFSRGVDESLNRIFRRINNFDKWAKCIDILQANDSELLTLSDSKDEEKILDELFSSGIKQIIITQADKGATVFFKQNDMITKIHRDAIPVNVVNKVGCGDVFGAVYFYKYLNNKDISLALENANLFAGISTTYLNPDDFLKLRKDKSEWLGQK